jgi:hypothetical protein
MPGVGLGSYYQRVWQRAWRDTVAFSKAQIVFSLVGALIVAGVTYRISADMDEPFNVKVAAYAAILAAMVIAAGNLVWNLFTVPYRLHHELLARLQAFERRPDVGRLVQLREHGVELLHRRVEIVERAHHDLSDEELRAYLAADNQELLTYQWKLRQWEEETTAELEKCATKSEVSLFRLSGSELSSFKYLGLATAREFPGVTAVLNREKAMLGERLERLLAVIRRIESGGAG